MGSVCLKSSDQIDNKEMATNRIEEKSEFPLDQENAAQTIQNNFHRLRANRKLRNNLEEVISEKLKNNGEKNIKIEPISIEEFNENLNKNPKYSETYEELKNSLEDIPQNIDGEEITYFMPPLKITNLDTNDTEYYSGSYNIKGELSGKGTLIDKDKNIYHGNFKKNMFNGKGILLNNNGDYYFGNWKNGECDGEGKLKVLNHSTYEGDFSQNKKNGKGIEHFDDGSTYSGEYLNNLKHGQGKFMLNNGAEYTGEFKNDLFNGSGEYIWPDGRSYKGDFKDGQMNGKGVNRFKDGSIYSGFYLNGKKHGNGMYTWPSGKKYYGNWVNNEPHGNGQFQIGPEKYNIVFRFGKIITCKGNKMDNNNVEKGDLVKFTKENVTNLFDLRNENLYFCQKCNYLIDNPVKCTNCNVNYCSKCVEDENKHEIPCIQCQQTNYEKNIELIQDLITNIKVKCPVCFKDLSYNDAINHRHENKN